MALFKQITWSDQFALFSCFNSRSIIIFVGLLQIHRRMKKLCFLLIAFTVSLSSFSQQTGQDAEADQIKKIIQIAYVEGLQNEGDTVKINLGFHPGFELLIPGKNGELEKYSLPEWKAKIKTNLASGKLPRKGDDKISIKFLFVDVTGNAAVAKFEFYVGSKLTFVDYQSLYKFQDGWKIVSKIFYKF